MPYLSKGRARDGGAKTPKEDRAKMFEIMKAMDVTDVKVLKESKTDTGYVLEAVGKGGIAPGNRRARSASCGRAASSSSTGRAGSSETHGARPATGPGRRSLPCSGPRGSGAADPRARRRNRWRCGASPPGSRGRRRPCRDRSGRPAPPRGPGRPRRAGARPCRPARSTGRRRRRRARPSARRPGSPRLARPSGYPEPSHRSWCE